MNVYSRLSLGALWLSIALIFSGCAAQSSVRQDEMLPMYGQPELTRSAEQKRHDDEFIEKMAARFSGSRERASTALWREAEAQLARGNYGRAMQYYNQSWLLNPDNYQPYWGFARIMLEQDKPDESIAFFATARKLCHDDYQKPGLLSDAGAAYSYKAHALSADDPESVKNYAYANMLFAESTSLDPKYANSWKQWAFSLYRKGDYAGAWEKIRKARALGAKELEVFLGNLSSRMPEPQ